MDRLPRIVLPAAFLVGCILAQALTPPGEAAAAARAKTPPQGTLPGETDLPFNNNKTPLAEEDFLLLNQSGYRIQADGTIRAPGSVRPLGQIELQMDIEELLGRKRLKAMLELEIVFNRYGYKNLPQDALADVRRISRQNWPILPEKVRADIRQYFSGAELERMDQGVKIVRAPATWIPLESMDLPPDMAPGSAAGKSGDSAPATVIAAISQEQEAAPLARKADIAVETPPPPIVPALPTAQAPSPPTVQSPIPEAALPAVQRIRELQAAEAAARAAAKSPAAAGTDAASASSMTLAALNTPPPATPQTPAFKVSEALPARMETSPSPAATPQSPAAPKAPVASPGYRDVSRETFDKFLADAPYGRDAQSILKLISAHAPPDLRRQALGYVMNRVPLVTLDSAGAGTQLRAALRRIHEDSLKPGQDLIMLNPGPPRIVRRSMFLGSREYLLPDAPGFYADLGVAPPPIQSASLDAVMKREAASDWGKVRIYDDNSQRLRFSQEQMAGTLLGQIVKLDQAPYASTTDHYKLELLARTAQFRFYRNFRQNMGTDPVLDRELQGQYREWLLTPEDHMDFLLQNMAAPASAGVLAILDGDDGDRSDWSKRHHLAVLESAGLDIPSQVKKALKPSPADLVAASLAATDQSIVREIKALESNSPVAAAWLAQEEKVRSELNAQTQK